MKGQAMRLIEEARIIEAHELRCENCNHQQTFKWPRNLADRRPEFILCRKCFMPVSVKFDSVPQKSNDLATPQNPAKTDLTKSASYQKPTLHFDVYEGQRHVATGDVEGLVKLINELELRVHDYCTSLINPNLQREEAALQSVNRCRAELLAALGVKKA